jgi:hypothetical protein
MERLCHGRGDERAWRSLVNIMAFFEVCINRRLCQIVQTGLGIGFSLHTLELRRPCFNASLPKGQDFFLTFPFETW